MIVNGHQFWVSSTYRSQLDIMLNEAIPNNWDCMFTFIGGEGSGKSTLASQTALYLSNKFNIDHTVFTPNQFEDAVERCKEEASILWDEAITGANVATHAMKMSVSIVSKLTQIRKKRIKFLLCFPYYHMLNKYYVSRMTGLIYVYAKDYNDRGYALFFNKNKAMEIYNLMKNVFKYNPLEAFNKIKSDFGAFKFPGEFCIDKKLYDEKKEKSRSDMDQEDDKTYRKYIAMILDTIKQRTPPKTLVDTAKLLGVHISTIKYWMKETDRPKV